MFSVRSKRGSDCKPRCCMQVQLPKRPIHAVIAQKWFICHIGCHQHINRSTRDTNAPPGRQLSVVPSHGSTLQSPGDLDFWHSAFGRSSRQMAPCQDRPITLVNLIFCHKMPSTVGNNIKKASSETSFARHNLLLVKVQWLQICYKTYYLRGHEVNPVLQVCPGTCVFKFHQDLDEELSHAHRVLR